MLYLTGYAQTLFDHRGILWEGEAFLEKPCGPAELLEAVSLLLFDRLAPTSVTADTADGFPFALHGRTKNPPGDVV